MSTYDNGNRMQHAQDLSGITSYTYDANGNQLTIEEPSGDITTNVWDGENRLVEVHHPSGDIVTYAYNGDGLRVWQDDGVDEVRYVHDGNNVLLETDGVGTVEAEFTYIPQAYVEGSVFGFQFLIFGQRQTFNCDSLKTEHRKLKTLPLQHGQLAALERPVPRLPQRPRRRPRSPVRDAPSQLQPQDRRLHLG